MKIALDFDETVTADETLWSRFVLHAKSRGHEVSIVTSRGVDFGNEDVEEFAATLGINIVYCYGGPKRNFFNADVWIDDTPESIPTYASSGGLHEAHGNT